MHIQSQLALSLTSEEEVFIEYQKMGQILAIEWNLEKKKF